MVVLVMNQMKSNLILNIELWWIEFSVKIQTLNITKKLDLKTKMDILEEQMVPQYKKLMQNIIIMMAIMDTINTLMINI